MPPRRGFERRLVDDTRSPGGDEKTLTTYLRGHARASCVRFSRRVSSRPRTSSAAWNSRRRLPWLWERLARFPVPHNRTVMEKHPVSNNHTRTMPIISLYLDHQVFAAVRKDERSLSPSKEVPWMHDAGTSPSLVRFFWSRTRFAFRGQGGPGPRRKNHANTSSTIVQLGRSFCRRGGPPHDRTEALQRCIKGMSATMIRQDNAGAIVVTRPQPARLCGRRPMGHLDTSENTNLLAERASLFSA